MYEVLKVKRDATRGEIKKAYHVAALKLHPDKGGDEETFKVIQNCYEVLASAEKRAAYDAQLAEAEEASDEERKANEESEEEEAASDEESEVPRPSRPANKRAYVDLSSDSDGDDVPFQAAGRIPPWRRNVDPPRPAAARASANVAAASEGEF